MSNTMNILEFIETQYPIRDRIKDKLSDPYKRIEEMDDLPYDLIGMDEYGHMTKLVNVDDVTTIPVMELISYTEDEIKQSPNEALRAVWYAYMEQIDITDMNFADIMECVRQYKANMVRREEQLGVLSV